MNVEAAFYILLGVSTLALAVGFMAMETARRNTQCLAWVIQWMDIKNKSDDVLGERIKKIEMASKGNNVTAFERTKIQ